MNIYSALAIILGLILFMVFLFDRNNLTHDNILKAIDLLATYDRNLIEYAFYNPNIENPVQYCEDNLLLKKALINYDRYLWDFRRWKVKDAIKKQYWKELGL